MYLASTSFLLLLFFGVSFGDITYISNVTEATVTNSYNNQNFGKSSSMCVNEMVVGAPHTQVGGATCGSALMYGRNQGGSNQWGFQQELFAPDGADGDSFGHAVTTQLGHVSVGAPNKGGKSGLNTFPNVGSVYYFNFDGVSNYNHRQTINNPTPCTGLCQNNFFGQALTYDGSTLVVGAPGNGNGMAYVYHRDTTTDQFSLVHIFMELLTDFAQFGSSVAAKDSVIAIGAPNYQVGGFPGAGAVFVYDALFNLLKMLTSQNPQNYGNYGASCSMFQGFLAAGAPGEHRGGVQCGQAYLHRKDHNGGNHYGWIKNLDAPECRHGDRYGHCCHVDDCIVIVGGPGSTDTDHGHTCVWHRTSKDEWNLFADINGENPGDGFGSSASSSMPYMTIGSDDADRDGKHHRGACHCYGVWTRGNVCGDPHFAGFDGSEFNFNGEDGAVFGIISDLDIVVNAEFASATVKGVFGTWMRRIAVIIPGESVLVDATFASTLYNETTVLRDNAVWSGRNLEVFTSGDDVEIRHGSWIIGLTFNNKNGESPYLDLHVQLRGPPIDPHGVLGQTARFLLNDGEKREPVRSTGLNGEGVVVGSYRDYMLNSLFDTQFVYSTYEPSSIKHVGKPAVRSSIAFPLMAYSFQDLE